MNNLLKWIALFLFSNLAFSQIDFTNLDPFKIPFDIGYFNARFAKAQHVDMLELIGNDYTINSQVGQNVLLGLGLLYSMPCKQLDLGLQVYYFNTTRMGGTIYEEGLFENLAYRYNIINTPIYFTAQKEFVLENKPYSLMLHGGIGPNIITLYNYNEYPITDYSISNNAFNSSVKAQFSATVGAGIKLSKQFELSYRFFYLGQSHLTPREGVLSSLNTANMYANTLVFTWFI